ncbi:MAG: S9 family peptidase [Alphaproteobacteria bacterium 32-64-14]|nr:MAG: S9 family peptidase [Alphaproteobacteria bacterium 32-64-14]
MRKLGYVAAAAIMLAAACTSVPADTASAAAKPFMPNSLEPSAVAAADEFLWLEDVWGERAIAWVKQQNAKTEAVFKADPRYEPFRQEALAILTAQDRTPTPAFRAEGIDNFWQDANNVRGVWRHTTLDSYRSGAPQWQTVLDIDALSKAENANWIFKGSDCVGPAETRCLVSLSDGGKDAVVVREFDTVTKAFVPGGFNIPEGKHRIDWLDADTLLVATDFGPGTLTESGYPFIVKALKRGQTLSQATEVYRGSAGDGGYGVSPSVYRDGSGKILGVIISRPLDTFRQETWELVDGKPVKLELPERVSVRGMIGFGDQPFTSELVFTIEEPWNLAPGVSYKSGTLLAEPISVLRSGGPVVISTGVPTVFVPTARQSIDEVRVFDTHIVATVYDNVRGRIAIFSGGGEGKGRSPGGWRQEKLTIPENTAVHLGSDSRSSDKLFYTYEGFLTPSTLALADVAAAKADVIRAAPARFDASHHVVEQYEAASKDGAKIPYFVVRPKGAPNPATPTMMFGYGGFQVSYPPVYKPELGKLWLERGGAYVIANIRGGGEFGPAWHQAALKGNRQRAFDDFAAVAADLATRKITSAKHLGIYGRSNGGVLTTVSLTQHPELLGAVVIESPLTDMLRYHELPPGASWMGEYGDPRIPEEAQWIAAYSGYQNIQKGKVYPIPYITTNTRDDRVHPGHARKFAARLQKAGYQALYYENTDGGHSNDSDPILNSERWARHYVYLAQQLGLGAGE